MRFVPTALLAGMLAVFTASPLAQDLEPTLQQAIDARRAARVAGNGEQWGRYTADDFTIIGPDGSIQDRSDRIAAINRGGAGAGNEPIVVGVQTYGNAVILTVDSNNPSSPSRFTTVWVKENNRWLVARTHVSRISQ